MNIPLNSRTKISQPCFHFSLLQRSMSLQDAGPFGKSLGWWKKSIQQESIAVYQERMGERKKLLDEALGAFKYAVDQNNNIEATVLGNSIAGLMQQELCTNDLFDVGTTKVLLESFGPVFVDGGVLKLNQCPSEALWSVFKKILSPHVTELTEDIINDSEAFPALAYHLREDAFVKDAEQKKKDCITLKIIFNLFIRNIPDKIYQEKGFGYKAETAVKKVIRKQYARKERKLLPLGVTLPKGY